MKNFKDYKNNDRKENLKLESIVVHGANGTDPYTGSLSYPIYQTATFKHPSIEDRANYNYARCINPTREELERTMCILENGVRGFAVNSGMAAVSLVFSLLNPGDHVILSDDIYGGTVRCVDEVLNPIGIESNHIDLRNLELLKETIKENTKMIFIETPTNPMMRVADIQAICEIGHQIGALVVVDNTFLTPYFQRPLNLSADIVLHSGTKYLGGHNDVLAGLVVVKDDKIGEKLEIQMYINGAGLGPMDSWILLRGIKTLALRMKKHEENAIKVAEFLRTHQKVEEVYFVGFESHPDYATTKKQSTGFGGMISFRVNNMETVNNLLNRIKLVTFAESLGGVESLITHPISRTHTEVSESVRNELGITDTLLRLSVGIEDADDIINDLKSALE
ncbi:MAG: PLP-dependent aspartate aminotransferase family protein [Bacilli bacterium]|nr:PLP-dependent aspartate aminotransferase family protein [Bacilli bacterium]